LTFLLASNLLPASTLQHAALYATHLGRARCGVLCNAADFFAAFGGQRRYFTYSLMPDSFRCSETGAQFFVDLSSKHAMHANASEEVLFAGKGKTASQAGPACGWACIGGVLRVKAAR
jgi:hypothetical protein